MRELFEDIAGHSPLDPHESARQSARAPQRKRFYKTAAFTETPDGFAITLDDKPVRTPTRERLVVPSRQLAEAIAAEWEAQIDVIDPGTMPLTRLAFVAVDRMDETREAARAEALRYAETDLTCYPSDYPQGLIAREDAAWLRDRSLTFAILARAFPSSERLFTERRR